MMHSDLIGTIAAFDIGNPVFGFLCIVFLSLVYFLRNRNLSGKIPPRPVAEPEAAYLDGGDNRLSSMTDTDMRNGINSLDTAHKSLLKLIEEPESNEPFIPLLHEIERLCHTRSSAIYIMPASADQFTLLECTDTNDDDWIKKIPLIILPKIFPPDTIGERQSLYEYSVRGDSKFICVQLHCGNQGRSILVLKHVPDFEISDTMHLSLLEHSNRLSNIVSSVQLARQKLRHAQYEERAVIARELHDSLAQSLSYLKIQTSRLQNILTSSNIQVCDKAMETDAMMQDLRSNLNIAYRHLRELISTFRLTMGGKNFTQALTDSVDEFAQRSTIAFDVDNRLPANILTVAEETQLLHIIRESLSNVVRHSQAKRSLVSIHYNDSGQIVTSIEDDGIGLANISDTEKHFGIVIMQERAHSIGGNISLSNTVDGGTSLKITFRAKKHIWHNVMHKQATPDA